MGRCAMSCSTGGLRDGAHAHSSPPSLCASPAAASICLPCPDSSFCVAQVGSNAGIVGMTKEHLGLALALNVPVFVVVTKIDMCPANILQGEWSLGQQQSVWGCRPPWLLGGLLPGLQHSLLLPYVVLRPGRIFHQPRVIAQNRLLSPCSSLGLSTV